MCYLRRLASVVYGVATFRGEDYGTVDGWGCFAARDRTMLHHLLHAKLVTTVLIAESSLILVLSQTSIALGQTRSRAERTLAEQIRCEEFTRDPDDGTWIGRPKARIGTSDFSNNRFKMKGIKINGVLVSNVLDSKCQDTVRMSREISAPHAYDTGSPYGFVFLHVLPSTSAAAQFVDSNQVVAGVDR
jgi:hypothetical protein